MNLRITTILAASGLIALGACTDPSMTTGTSDQGMSRTAQGAIAGSLAGAVLGATTAGSDTGRSAAKGAVMGGIVGAVAGNMMDRQAQALQQSISNPNIQIVNHGNYLQVIMPEGILFATESAAVSGAAQNDLYAVARNLNQYPNTVVEVVGHTDNTGSAAFNRDLSLRRAQSVAAILTAGGVSSNRVATTGRGYDQPIASNATAEGRAQNRRVEILIRPTR